MRNQRKTDEVHKQGRDGSSIAGHNSLLKSCQEAAKRVFGSEEVAVTDRTGKTKRRYSTNFCLFYVCFFSFIMCN